MILCRLNTLLGFKIDPLQLYEWSVNSSFMLQQKRMCDMMCCKPVFYLSFGFPAANPANSTDQFISFMYFPRQRSMLIACYWRKIKRLFKEEFPLVGSNQGHPTTVYCEISVRRSKYGLEFSITWGRLKVLDDCSHSCTVFEANI